jgi:ubiquinone biosynthesis UbiH/UbiF/VisC/COQ6 family hydroxylase
MKKQAQSFDILVVGGGPTGLAFAKALADTSLSIGVIEPQDEAVLNDPPYDGRETALTHLSMKILRELDILPHIAEDDISFIKHAHVINGDEPYALKFDHHEAGEETLGYMISNQNVRKASFQAVKDVENVTLICGEKVDSAESSAGGVSVTLASAGTLKAKLLIGADGRFSATRRMMGIPADMDDLGRTCIVGVMTHDKPHNDTAYECFHYDRTLAVLPLNSGRVSIVITLPSDQADDLLSLSPEEFSKDIEERFEGRVGAMRLDGKLHPYPLVCSYAKSFIADRFALLGDAAVGMHPVTAHGYNLGLRGAHTLAGLIRKAYETGGDIASPLVLRAYNRKHQIVCKPLYVGTHIVERLYTDTRPPAKFARKALLRLGNLVKPANKLIMNQLTESRA